MVVEHDAMTSHAGDGSSSRRKKYSQEAGVPVLGLLAPRAPPVTGPMRILTYYLRCAVNPVRYGNAGTVRDLFGRLEQALRPQADNK